MGWGDWANETTDGRTNENGMKRILQISIVLIVWATVVGCGRSAGKIAARAGQVAARKSHPVGPRKGLDGAHTIPPNILQQSESLKEPRLFGAFGKPPTLLPGTLNYSGERLQAIGEALWGETAKGPKGALTDPAKAVLAIWTANMSDVSADALGIIKSGIKPGADAKARLELTRLLVSGDPERKPPQIAFAKFLIRVRDAETVYSKNPASTGPPTFGNIRVPDSDSRFGGRVTIPIEVWESERERLERAIKEAVASGTRLGRGAHAEGLAIFSKPLPLKEARLLVTGARHNRPAPYPGIGDFLGWPGGIDRLPNGDLLVVHSSGYWHSSFAQPRQIEPGLAKRWRAEGWPLDFPAPTGGRTMACRSTDGGKTWSKPFTILDHRLDDGAHAIVTLPSGRVICLIGVQASWYGYNRAPKGFEKDIDGLNTKQFVIHSDDNGKTWSKPRGLKSPGNFYERCHGGRPVVLSDGSLIWATYYQVRGEKFLRGAIRRSTDNGLTWPVISTIIRKDNNLDEPAIAELKDGRIVLVTRPDAAIFHSSDKGVTWKDSGSRIITGGGKFKAPQLVTLEDGTLVAIATWRNLRAWISRDGGLTWTKDLPLDVGSYGYPGSYILDSDGSILFPYCGSGRAPNQVYLLRFQVNKTRTGVKLLPVTKLKEITIDPVESKTQPSPDPVGSVNQALSHYRKGTLCHSKQLEAFPGKVDPAARYRCVAARV